MLDKSESYERSVSGTLQLNFSLSNGKRFGMDEAKELEHLRTACKWDIKGQANTLPRVCALFAAMKSSIEGVFSKREGYEIYEEW